MSLVFPTSLEAPASLIDIQLKNESIGPFVFNEQQIELSDSLIRGESLILLKARQIGATTLFLFWIFNLALLNPRHHFGIVFQDQTVAREKLQLIKDWCEQLGVALPINNADKIRLFNSSEIHAEGARKGEAAGEDSTLFRGQTLSAVLLSEAAFYRNTKAYASVKAAVGTGPVVVESTASGPSGLFWDLWNNPSNRLKKVFYGVESHSKYQVAPSLITDDEWESLKQDWGFKSRTHAAWWHLELQETGDVVSHLREYPVLEQHPFQVNENRWVLVDPVVSVPVKVVGEVEFFQEPVERHRYVAGVDVSSGTGRDYSVVMMLDRSTGEIVGCWESNVATLTQMMEACSVMMKEYRVDVFVVEADGVGLPAIQRANEFGLPLKAAFTRDSDPYGAQRARLLAVKQGIEGGVLKGPMILKEEAQDLHLDRRDRFAGRKDAMMATGLAVLYVKDNPYQVPAPPVDSTRVYRPRRSNGAWA